MTNPIPYLTPNRPMDFPNQKPFLMALGIVLIVAGGLLGCAGAASVASMLRLQSRLGASDPLAPYEMILALVMYTLVTFGIIWCGVGCVLARRWTRPILMILSAWAVVIGCFSVISAAFAGLVITKRTAAMAVSAPAATTPYSATATPTTTYTSYPGSGVVLLINIAAAAVFLIAIPAVVWWFMRRQLVKQTVEFYDPTPRWTDSRPFPVLAIALVTWTWATLRLAQALNGVSMLFGWVLMGTASMVAMLVVSIILTAIGYLAWRQLSIGWWMLVLTCAALGVSSILNAMFIRIEDVLTAMDLPAEAVIELEQQSAGSTWIGSISSCLLMAAAIAYLVYHRRHFFGAKETPAGAI